MTKLHLLNNLLNNFLEIFLNYIGDNKEISAQ